MKYVASLFKEPYSASDVNIANDTVRVLLGSLNIRGKTSRD